MTKAQIMKIIPSRLHYICGEKPTFESGNWDDEERILDIRAEMYQSVSGSAGIKRLAWLKDNIINYWPVIKKEMELKELNITLSLDYDWFFGNKSYMYMVDSIRDLGVHIEWSKISD